VTATTTTTPCKIVPGLRHDGSGVTTEWSVHPDDDPWGEQAQDRPRFGFESLEAAAKWATANGYTPDLRDAENRRLWHNLFALGDECPLSPWELADVIVESYGFDKLASFAVRFRRQFEAKVDLGEGVIDF
jgi:hypothetical protein